MADFRQLETDLDLAEAALIAGDLQSLERLTTALEAALSADGNGDHILALRIADKARRNEALISAALKGVHSARRRVDELSDQGRFSTYDSGGHREQPGLQAPIGGRRL